MCILSHRRQLNAAILCHLNWEPMSLTFESAQYPRANQLNIYSHISMMDILYADWVSERREETYFKVYMA